MFHSYLLSITSDTNTLYDESPRTEKHDLTAPMISLEQILEVSESPEEEKHAYMAQKNKKAPGPEKLPAKVLKMISVPPTPFS